MKLKKGHKFLAGLVWGALLFSACPNNSDDESDVTESLVDDSLPGTTGGRSLARRLVGYEDIDGLSSASILRAGRDRLGYIDKKDDGYHIKLVDVSDPEKAVREKLVAGTGDNVALWTTGYQDRIILATANEYGYEAFIGIEVVVYDQDLKLIGRFPFGGNKPDAMPLHHRDPALAVTDKYAIAGWDSEAGGGTFISIYALDESKTGHIKTSSLSFEGDITAFAACGDFMIIGDSAKTGAFKINDSGETIVLESAGSAQTAGAHWMLNNQSYVLEPVSNAGTVRVWQWNGASAPTVKGIANVGATSGSVQAISFDNDNSATAYVFGRATSNAGDVYSINLTNGATTKLFNIPGYYTPASTGRGGAVPAVMGGPLTGIWTIQVEKIGADTYYVLGGTIAGTPAGADLTRAAVNGVLVIKNPRETVSQTVQSGANNPVVAALTDFPTAIRTMKTFKSGNSVYYAAKNYTANPISSSAYMLRLMPLNETTSPTVTVSSNPGTSGGKALSKRAGGYEDIDGLSSASILRAGRGKFGYIDKKDDGYHIKLVNATDPTTTDRDKLVPGGANVALWTTGDGDKIIMATANEYGYESFFGLEVVVMDQTLSVLARFPLGNKPDAMPLHHRDPALAVTDKYAIAGWDSEAGGGTYISIYALDGSKTGHIKTSSLSFAGDITAFAAHGDFMIIGDSAKTGVFKINASGAAIALTAVGSAQTSGAHWMLDNQKYVLEPVSGMGTVRVWQWNGANAPTVKGTATVGATSGNVQAISFDNDPATNKAYVFGRASSNVGDVYSINLTTATATKIFNIPGYYTPASGGRNPAPAVMGDPLTGIWTIQVEKSGTDAYYVLGGTIAGKGSSGDADYRAAVNGVLVIKNPPAIVSQTVQSGANNPVVAALALTDFPTAVRTMKTFTAGSDIYYAAKNYTANPITSSAYMLRFMNVNN
ncbi:MAG: hypothetical protein LBG73_05380 [Spirochaetaceae bacterium]|jgi:hypothetical protein|nr:hypothetical protein [Spirochaetaceae bacterium]